MKFDFSFDIRVKSVLAGQVGNFIPTNQDHIINHHLKTKYFHGSISQTLQGFLNRLKQIQRKALAEIIVAVMCLHKASVARNKKVFHEELVCALFCLAKASKILP